MFLKYARARFNIEYVYRVYVTDGIKACADNLANAFGGTQMTERYAMMYEPTEKRNAEEIKQSICKKLNNMRSE